MLSRHLIAAEKLKQLLYSLIAKKSQSNNEFQGKNVMLMIHNDAAVIADIRKLGKMKLENLGRLIEKCEFFFHSVVGR